MKRVKMKRAKMKKLMGLFVLCSLFLSCEDILQTFLTKNIEVKFDYALFAEQRQQWQAAQIKNYRYTLTAAGFDSYHGVIIVEDGKFKQDTPLYEYGDINSFLEYSTIDEIYHTIEEVYTANNNTEQNVFDVYLKAINVEYDTINHIPISINYGYYIPDHIALDGTFDYEIEDFEKDK
ncbi:MAG: DUF6174 domain-containing protein [Spirochaetaceae bacterium]|jgi:hypothetical protein|nr:DUF6174 domain-containing protein [Spirochaetaceae bacterium]